MHDRHLGTTLVTILSTWKLRKNHHREDLLWLNVISSVLFQWYNNGFHLHNNPDGIVISLVWEREECQLWSLDCSVDFNIVVIQSNRKMCPVDADHRHDGFHHVGICLPCWNWPLHPRHTSEDYT